MLSPAVVPGPFTGIYPMAFDPPGKWLAIQKDAQVYLIDTEADPTANTEAPPRIFRGHEATLLEVVFGENGRRLVTLDRSGVVKQWDPAPRERLPRTAFARAISGSPGAFPSPDGRRVAFDRRPQPAGGQSYSSPRLRQRRVFLN